MKPLQIEAAMEMYHDQLSEKEQIHFAETPDLYLRSPDSSELQ